MLWGRDFPYTVPPSNTPAKPRISLYGPCFEGKAHNYHPAQKEEFIRQNPCLYPAKKEEAYTPKYSPAIKQNPYLALTSWCFAVRLLRFCILPFPLRGRGNAPRRPQNTKSRRAVKSQYPYGYFATSSG
jgi:hypothetical protein